MSATITIFRGADRKIRIPTNLDLTLATMIEVCFTQDTGKYHALFLAKTGDIAIGSPTVANINITNLAVGQEVQGAGIPVNTFIQTIGVGSITLTNNATATTTGLALSIGNVSLLDAANGLMRVKLYGADTATFKKSATTIGFTFLINGFTTKGVSDPVLDIQDDPC